jgi:ATP-binding cassette subfamily B protein/ATP-binding cassette subfamily C protein LapB
MILSFYFSDISLETLKKLSPSPLEKFSFSDIEYICDELSLSYESKKMKAHEIQKHMLPCIAYNKKGEAVVIEALEDEYFKVKKRYYSTSEKISKKDISKQFKNFMFISKDEFQKPTMKIENSSKDWFYAPIRKSWRSYIEIGILTIFINIFGLGLPLFTMSVYNRVVPNFAVETLFVLSIGVGIILVFDVILKSARMHILEKVVKNISNHLEEELFKKTLSIQSKYDHYLVGTKTNLFKELHVVKDFFATKVIHLLDVPFFFTAIIVIYMIDPMITFVPLIAAVLSLGLNFVMQYPIASWHKKGFEEAQSKQGYLIEQLQGQEPIKLANALPKSVHKWRRIVNFYHHIQTKVQFLQGVTSSISYAILQGVSLMTVVVGVFSIHNGSLNVGGLIAVTILSSRAMVPIINLSNVLLKYKQVKEALDSLDKYWKLPTESQRYSELGVAKAKGDIEFENVSFAYANSKHNTIENVSFSIKAGERVGIIGQTGAGKSTIQKLLTMIEEPTAGKIYLDDMDISTIHPVELRENIALMPQEPYLFSGTLKENLELNRAISKDEMMSVLKKTGLDALVKKSGSAESLDVGERGMNLSVGQRHLVALARTLMNNSSVLILDEPTTGLDVGLEKKLITQLKEEIQEKTLIVITHRFAALELVDRVILMNDGKIVADGKKEDVLALLNGKKVNS